MMDIVSNSARFSRADETAIDCVISTNGEQLPFTATDGDDSTVWAWSILISGEAGDIAPYVAPEPVEPTPEQIKEAFRVAIQAHIDAAAIGRLYDSGNSLATYVSSTNAQWAAEAAVFVVWRDAVWTYAYAELDKVLAGEREQPTIGAFIGELPEIDWPE